MPAPLSAEAKALIDRPNFAHLATLMSDGAPHSVPVWVGREGDRLVVCTSEGSLKGRNTRRDPRIALSIGTSTIRTRRCSSAAAWWSGVPTPTSRSWIPCRTSTPGRRSRCGAMRVAWRY